METNRLCSDHMHEGTALDAGENHRVDLFPVFFLAQDDSAAGPSQALVVRGGDKMRVRNGARVLATCNQPGDVRHIYKEQRSAGVGDVPQTGKIKYPRIS